MTQSNDFKASTKPSGQLNVKQLFSEGSTDGLSKKNNFITAFFCKAPGDMYSIGFKYL